LIAREVSTMKRKTAILFLICMITIIASSCGEEEMQDPQDKASPAPGDVALEEPIEGEPVQEAESEPLFRSSLTGLPVEEDLAGKRPIAIMLDNHIGARPQSGLAQAEIVFEILAEGNITRYMAIIQEADMNSIGPVRSARPYFIDKALEYDALYVHVGGSLEALSDINDLNMADIDGMTRGKDTFWRVNHKKIPHNMYTSTKAIRAAADRSGYRKSFDIEFASFSEENQSFSEFENLESISFGFSRYYKPSFIYNEEDALYERKVKGVPQLEEFSSEPVVAKNIIVLKMNTKVIDNEGRLDIETIGKGSGYYITSGKKIDIEWEKQGRRAKTAYTVNGEELLLNPGNTWIVIVPINLEINVNN